MELQSEPVSQKLFSRQKAYRDLTWHMTVQVATLRSAVKLEQEQQFLIAKKLQELTGSKNIKLKPVIDEELIAGFVVEYGSSQVRCSVTIALLWCIQHLQISQQT